jgi:hypothetical protein
MTTPKEIRALHRLRNLVAECEEDENRYTRFSQPVATLFADGGYASTLLEDGTEVFMSHDMRVTVPPTCVEWLHGIVPDLSAPRKLPEEHRELLYVLSAKQHGANVQFSQKHLDIIDELYEEDRREISA